MVVLRINMHLYGPNKRQSRGTNIKMGKYIQIIIIMGMCFKGRQMRKLAFLFNFIIAYIKQIIKGVLMESYPIVDVCSLPQGFR